MAGTGSIRIAFQPKAAQSRVLKFEAMLLGDDGSAFALRDLNSTVNVPAGRYALGSMTFSLSGTEANTPWHFTFSRPGRPSGSQWHAVGNGEEVSIEAVGKLRFALEGVDAEARVPAGAALNVNPRLYTSIHPSGCERAARVIDQRTG